MTAARALLVSSPPLDSLSQHAAAVTGDGKYAFIFGGYDGTKCLNDLWLLDLGGMALRHGGSAKTAKAHQAVP